MRLLNEAGVAVLADIHFGPRVPGRGPAHPLQLRRLERGDREGCRAHGGFRAPPREVAAWRCPPGPGSCRPSPPPLLGAALALPVGPVLAIASGAMLVAAVIAAVHHAEVVAHRVGEPFGTLVLAVAVTVIEASLILSMMLAGGPDTAVLPRDTIFSAVMIICNGVVGICLLVGGLHHREQSFRVEGAGPALAALVALATLSLVLPSFTTTRARRHLQRVAARLRGRRLRGALGRVRLRADGAPPRLLPARRGPGQRGSPRRSRPRRRRRGRASALLLVSLVAVVGLAKMLSPTIERRHRRRRRAARR